MGIKMRFGRPADLIKQNIYVIGSTFPISKSLLTESSAYAKARTDEAESPISMRLGVLILKSGLVV